MSDKRSPLSIRQNFLPEEIEQREFGSVFRGYDNAEVRTFLRQLAEQAKELMAHNAEMEAQLEDALQRIEKPELTEELVTSMMGEHTAQILRSAREAASNIREEADSSVTKQLRDAELAAQDMRAEAEVILNERTKEAETAAATIRAEAMVAAEKIRQTAAEEAAAQRAQLEIELATRRLEADQSIADERALSRQQARELVSLARNESKELVERTQDRQQELLESLVRKRKIALAQVEELRAGRERLLHAYRIVRSTLDDVTVELERVEDEARQTAFDAGRRSAQTSGIVEEALDEAVEMESFEHNDDVSQTVINLIENGGDESSSSHSAFRTEPVTPIAPSGSGGERDSEEMKEEASRSVAVATLTASEKSEEVLEEATPTAMIPLVAESHTVVEEDVPTQVDLPAVARDPEAQPTAILLPEDVVQSIMVPAKVETLMRLRDAMAREADELIETLVTQANDSADDVVDTQEMQMLRYQEAVLDPICTAIDGLSVSKGASQGLNEVQLGTVHARELANELTRAVRKSVVPTVEELVAGSDHEYGISPDVIRECIDGAYREVITDALEDVVDTHLAHVCEAGGQVAASTVS